VESQNDELIMAVVIVSIYFVKLTMSPHILFLPLNSPHQSRSFFFVVAACYVAEFTVGKVQIITRTSAITQGISARENRLPLFPYHITT
jgi:hypothetical protein